MREVMSNHVKGCESCKEDDRLLRGLSHALRTMPEVDPPSFFADNVMARIEREHSAGPWWERMLAKVPYYGRTAIGVGLAAGVVAAVMITRAPGTGKEVNNFIPGTLLPDIKRAVTLPKLGVSDKYVVTEKQGRCYDFIFLLKNAENGVANVHVMDADRDYSFPLKDKQESAPLRVPLSVVGQEKAVGIAIEWQAQSESRQRALYVPTPEAMNATNEKKTFDLPEESLGEAVRDLAGEYGETIAIEDAPLKDVVRLNANNETLAEALQRQLSGYNLKVVTTASGIAVFKEDGKILMNTPIPAIATAANTATTAP